ncbi:hypothetical protein JTB14_010658 [Gonioctena quinquepunctata]|nr:hypothetical protein JTB14_010658 [Gonioctena quinquepunctata]
MSDIDTMSTMASPSETSTLKIKSEPESKEESPAKTESKTSVCNIVNDLKFTNNSNTEQSQKHNNDISKPNNTDENKKVDGNEHNLPKLKIGPQNMDQTQLVNDLSKARSPIEDRNSTDLVFTIEKGPRDSIPVSNNKQKQPIMGKAALLKKANIDADSRIIQGIILNKYETVLNHYVSRMYKRRASRLSSSEYSEDEFGESLSSPFPVFTPTSLSSIETPGSMAGDVRNRFEFPVCESRFPYYANYYVPKSNLDFLLSTDDVNVETTTEELNDSSMLSSDTGHDSSMTTVSEYDPKKFLENALGDLTNLSESGVCDNLSVSMQIQGRQRDQSVGSSNISSLLSKAGSFYSSVTKNIKRRRHSLKTACLLEENQSDHHSPATRELLESLKKELLIQNAIMFQISKALNYCRASKEFVSGIEHIEAEKILLVATITKEALINEINTIEFNTYQSNFDPRCTGEIRIHSVSFLLREKTSVLPQHPDSKEYFLAVAACGRKIISSEVAEATDGVVVVEKCFGFANLLADFETCLSVYSMMVRNKVHIIQENMRCPSPKSIFRCNKDSRRDRSPSTLYIEPLAFTLLGRCFIRNQALSKTKDNNTLSLKLHNVLPHSSIGESVSMRIDYNFRLTNRTSGFLTIGTENDQMCTTWNRRWCLLEGYVFKYWNYPSEEVTASLGNVDLSYCIAQSVVPADRKICARPKTLMIPVESGRCVKKYLLSADTNTDMEMWEKELNFVIKSLMMWNGMKSGLYSS